MNGYFNYKDELYHYGVLGMKWGIRRYQPYGSGGYTPKGKKSNGKKFGGFFNKKSKKTTNELTKKQRTENELKTKNPKGYEELISNGYEIEPSFGDVVKKTKSKNSLGKDINLEIGINYLDASEDMNAYIKDVNKFVKNFPKKDKIIREAILNDKGLYNWWGDRDNYMDADYNPKTNEIIYKDTENNKKIKAMSDNELKEYVNKQITNGGKNYPQSITFNPESIEVWYDGNKPLVYHSIVVEIDRKKGNVVNMSIEG